MMGKTVCYMVTQIALAPFPLQELFTFTRDFENPWRVFTEITHVKSFPRPLPSPKKT